LFRYSRGWTGHGALWRRFARPLRGTAHAFRRAAFLLAALEDDIDGGRRRRLRRRLQRDIDDEIEQYRSVQAQRDGERPFERTAAGDDSALGRERDAARSCGS
jgi:hypothetical protein